MNTQSAIDESLKAAEDELLQWCHPTAPKSHWNDLHGSVTGDYPGQYERTARADAAEVEKLTNTVIALRLLAANRD